MKRIFAVTAAIFTCAFVIGTGSAGAGELLDSGRIIAAMEDQYQGYNYRNTMDLDKFVAALEDNRSGDYRNTHTRDSYVASLQDNHEGYYRNTHTQDSYIASLQDNHPGYYRNIHTQESFVAALGDGYASGRYGAMAIRDSRRFAGVLAEKHGEEASAAAPAPQCGHRDIDYLGADIVLAKLAEACE